jgi:hypothetical protein
MFEIACFVPAANAVRCSTEATDPLGPSDEDRKDDTTAILIATGPLLAQLQTAGLVGSCTSFRPFSPVSERAYQRIEAHGKIGAKRGAI